YGLRYGSRSPTTARSPLAPAARSTGATLSSSRSSAAIAPPPGVVSSGVTAWIRVLARGRGAGAPTRIVSKSGWGPGGRPAAVPCIRNGRAPGGWPPAGAPCRRRSGRGGGRAPQAQPRQLGDDRDGDCLGDHEGRAERVRREPARDERDDAGNRPEHGGRDDGPDGPPRPL